MNLLSAFILGIVEGITEFLPISSTAHLILASTFLKLAQTEFTKTFEIAIQSGAILAVVALYWRLLFSWPILKRLVIGFIPTGILGLLFYRLVKTYIFENTNVILWALFLGGVGLIIFERFHHHQQKQINTVAEIPYRTCALIGVFQAFAIIPGVSRSAATIIGGMLLGINRETIVAFSFLLAVPTLLAATGFDLIKTSHVFTASDLTLLGAGTISSFVVAIISIKFLLAYVRKHTFFAFGIYRILLAAALFFILK